MSQANGEVDASDPVEPAPPNVSVAMEEVGLAAGGPWQPDPGTEGAIGYTMFDAPSSEDNTVTVLLPAEGIASMPSQALVRIRSSDGRVYLGMVVEGPFAEADGLRADSNLLVVSVTRGRILLPRYHGRVVVEILGEERDGVLEPPRFRPLPNSPVWALTPEETARVLQAEGDLQLGLAVGHENLRVGIPSDRKSVLPRHTAVLGTTGGGKSTTVSRLIAEAQRVGMAVIVFDVEGEYTHLHEPTDDEAMRQLLQRRGQTPRGVPNTAVFHLVGRDTANPGHPNRRSFALRFSSLSPYTVMDVLDLPEAQQQRFMRAYDVARQMLKECGIFPRSGHPEDEVRLQEYDEFEEGYPQLTLGFLLTVAYVCAQVADKAADAEITIAHRALREHREELLRRVRATRPDHSVSWRSLLGKLGRLNRLKVFDNPQAQPPNYAEMVQAGHVTIIDLSDTGSAVVNNLVIADLLRGIQQAQEQRYEEALAQGREPARTLIVIEEAHEFLSAQRLDKMPHLFQQVERIARRGRKRWLGLVFVTQAPEHLPQEVLGLINNVIIHRIKGERVVATLARNIGGVEEGLWRRLPNLAPGQAIVSFTHLARPLLVAVDPTPARLRMVE